MMDKIVDYISEKLGITAQIKQSEDAIEHLRRVTLDGESYWMLTPKLDRRKKKKKMECTCIEVDKTNHAEI